MPQPRTKKTLRLVEKSEERLERESPRARHFEDLVIAVFARWRGHEPEIAILSTTTFILAIAGVFAGADLLFTLLVVAAAAVTVWSPWRHSR